jgi:hypothetical protein
MATKKTLAPSIHVLNEFWTTYCIFTTIIDLNAYNCTDNLIIDRNLFKEQKRRNNYVNNEWVALFPVFGDSGRGRVGVPLWACELGEKRWTIFFVCENRNSHLGNMQSFCHPFTGCRRSYDFWIYNYNASVIHSRLERFLNPKENMFVFKMHFVGCSLVLLIFTMLAL